MRKKLLLPSIMAALLATAVTAQASLIQWLTTTNVSSVQTNANGWVTNWLDSSGSANHTANAGVVVGTNLYPSSSLSASGKPGVDLGLGRNGFRLWSIAAQDTWLDFTQAGPSGAQGKSGFAVLVAFKVDANATNLTSRNIVIGGHGAPGANASFVLKYETGYPACYIGNSGSNPQYINTNAAAALQNGDTVVFAFNYSAASGFWELWDSKSGGRMTNTAAANGNFSSALTMYLGTSENGGQWMSGDVFEVRVYDNVMTTTDLTNTLQAMKMQWATPTATVLPPTFTSALAGDSVALLSWLDNNVAGVVSNFYLYRSLVSGSSYTAIATNSGTSYIDLTVTNGTTYYYVLKAISTNGTQSAFSAEVAVTPQAISTNAVLIQHLDADIPSSVISVGGQLLTWFDQTTNLNDGSPIVGTPLYPSASLSGSSKAGVDLGTNSWVAGATNRTDVQLFTSANQNKWLNFTGAALTNGGFSALVAFKADSIGTGNARNTVLVSHGDPSVAQSFGLRYNDNGYMQAFLGGTTYLKTNNAPVKAGDTVVYAFNYDEKTGVIEFWDSKNKSSLTATNTAYGNFASAQRLRLGTSDNNGQRFDGMVGEVKIYAGKLSSADLLAEGQSLATKWGAQVAATNNYYLSNLVLSSGTLAPAFSTNGLSYTASVSSSVSNFTVTPTAASASSVISVQINGGGYANVASGSPSGALVLNEGTNTVEIKITAENQAFFQTYTVSVVGASTPPQTTVNLSPKTFVSGDGVYTDETFEGRPVWVPSSTNSYLYFDVPGFFAFTVGQPVYVRIEYHDAGQGRLAAQYDSTGSAYQNAELHTRSSRVGRDEFVYSYQCFKSPLFAGRQNGSTDFRFRLNGTDGTPLRVASVQISTTPYNDPQFTYALSQPWLSPYAGPSKDFVNSKTLVGKVLAGYQGWFAAPNDTADNGWNHWGRTASVDPAPDQITVDQWPWLDEYETDRVYPAGNMVHQDGRPAYLFSSRDPETVQRHFRWMRKYNIDGVYLQRFVTRGNSGYYGASEFTLNNVRQAANQEGRVWAIEYDVSSLDTDPNPFEVMTNDWNYLVNQCGITNDPRYLRENGKPVLFIWGFSAAGRDFSVAQADEIMNWFTSQNLYLIGGVPSSWQSSNSWFGVYQKFDQLLAWQESSLTGLNSQKTQLNGWGMKILPHAWPGFSWNNLQRTVFPDSSNTARNGGAFYWAGLTNALSCGADQIFLGMFDEYDEGTAIMPMSDNHPDIYDAGGTNTWGHYLDNEGREPFWYLRLSGAGKEMLSGQRTVSGSLPSSNALSAVSFAGADATSYLGTTNNNQGLSYAQPTADGVTGGTVLGGQNCRTNGNIYFYFQVDDAFCVSNSAGQSATIEIEYYDNVAGANIQVQYDSVTNPFTATTQFSTTGSGGWKNYRWNVNNAFFGNRETGASDLRVAILNAVSAGKVVGIRRVSVFLPEEKSGTVVSNAPAMQLANGRLTWSGQADATGWGLSRSGNLGSGNWQELATPTNWLAPGPFSITNRIFRYQMPLTNSAGFYRLGRPLRQ